ncbi:3-oxoacyl-[acyl-carrier-protein] synthase II [Povalibacter uvarum]|uniref:3-oxoacyl-[acyl-carrier-protein] synthase II n=1 Tax=Povalibacter uvarum TaxID=732238 RepID=A0A841HM97_9GAMM|nr:beta-ketoacyl-ACP synthase [Povalibacter uvarum]MBB6093400.1 3-oxoacyl-[acyl-carrier-protein] synthase II [Povalibacter uvarum]
MSGSAKRVVVTGFGGITALGHDWPTIARALRANMSGIARMHEWDRYTDLNTRLGGPVPPFQLPPQYTRKVTRTMGRVALLATRATEMALEDAGLTDDPVVTSGAMGVAYGSCTGSPDAIREFGSMIETGDVSGINATTYLRLMPHTAAANIGVYFGIKGRVIPACSACTSGSQSIGYAYEAIRFNRSKLMVAGGAEELCASEAAVFDTLYATSTRNDTPSQTPSPFDRDRDGLVIGEGACTLILEELEHAKARGATIYAEIVGFGSNSDGDHPTHPNTNTMEVAMKLALDDAQLPPSAIGYVNAHATATEQGDIAETHAMQRLFGSRTPVSSVKGHLGHTLGACGAIESWFTIQMMREGWFMPTLNLNNVDERCGELDYVMNGGRDLQCEYVMKNNFAFGGVNTSLVFRRWAA